MKVPVEQERRVPNRREAFQVIVFQVLGIDRREYIPTRVLRGA